MIAQLSSGDNKKDPSIASGQVSRSLLAVTFPQLYSRARDARGNLSRTPLRTGGALLEKRGVGATGCF